jgi:hypothetical protein
MATMDATNNLIKGVELLTQWLMGAIFVGFRFGSNFTLFFDREDEAKFEGKSLPWQIRLDLLEDWWFGNEREWREKVANDGVGVEPEEPIKAFELAKLRWSEGAVVSSVVANETKLSISFENGTVIHVQLTEEDEYTYSARENCEVSGVSEWRVTLDGTGFHLKAP